MKKSINLDISYRCTLECPKCRRQQSLKRLGNYGHDISIENFKKILLYFDRLNFCGSISDPVMHPKFIEFLSLSINHKVKISTAVSQKSMRWYESALESNPKAEWHFGLDGLPEESHLYRINQNGTKLFEVMKLAASMGIKTYWQYIVFKYNQDHIDQAKDMAKNYGIIFKEQHSSRWDIDDPYKPDEERHYIIKHYDKEIKQKFQAKLYLR